MGGSYPNSFIRFSVVSDVLEEMLEKQELHRLYVSEGVVLETSYFDDGGPMPLPNNSKQSFTEWLSTLIEILYEDDAYDLATAIRSSSKAIEDSIKNYVVEIAMSDGKDLSSFYEREEMNDKGISIYHIHEEDWIKLRRELGEEDTLWQELQEGFSSEVEDAAKLIRFVPISAQ